jgi:uncharacterized protein YndB with AHSA1/START domain
MVVARVRLPGCLPERALTAFTDAAVLARWWYGELSADLVPGGVYSVSFPKVPARLAGHVIDFVPGSSLRFSWAWEGEDGHPVRTVTVRTEARPPADGAELAGETVLIIEHGPHADDDEGRTARVAHWEGWQHFLPDLPAAVGSA